MSKLIFEKHVPFSNSFSLPPCEVPEVVEIPEALQRKEKLSLPEVSEVETIRHFTELSRKAYGVDSGFYPLGSCTMKYNPKIDEWAARLPGFANIHPYQPEETVQGALELMYEMEKMCCEIAGMDRFTLQPAAGAHGEMTGVMIIKAYHKKRGDEKRTKILVPDSAHGTNPATANVVGYDVVEVKSNDRGLVDIEDLKAKMSDEVAGLMLTNPNTLGLFEEEIVKIASIVHEGGGLLYYDGANLNAIMGVCRPGDMGFDIVHLNLHKTFGTPHGGGGPGSGPVGVKAFLAEFLPVPVVEKKGDKYVLDYDRPESIGKVKNFYGNFGVVVKAYTYIKSLGRDGLKDVAYNAVLNANYLRHHLSQYYNVPYNRLCKHEFIANSKFQHDKNGITTMDIAKRLLDYGYHPPTVYFPLIVHEAIMIEPTETETKERLDDFIKAMADIAREAEEEPEKVKNAPHTTVVKRIDEVGAARNPIVKWEEE
ncbi:aminomethyl-transferring glycine dehydrogenase subunit GcvPB [Thermosyntropha sp.]|uniref:aminomethyl-transferring glycine dehydrogenase subunit GcvPB n=1 Tax=Thermosyntropha sp. TaxID=2740820 RepID=UPI0025CEA310|nr:aminomethyl-transferring glycine dehydrogenase subunit GcvPB [Thermosyntropha sp.]MBO8159831.1 aminomethyl-transferring glycine dehydrogenase subunit GcvPB [Thermosyntropha sp.]